MAMKVWNVGDVLTAQDLNLWTQPRQVVKQSDTSRTSNTTLTSDPELTLPLDANSQYVFDATILYTTTSVVDFKVQFTGPAGLTGTFGLVGNTTGTGFGITTRNFSTWPVTFGGLTIEIPLLISGAITTTGTAGNLVFQWAQNVSSATALAVNQFSFMRLQKYA